MNPIIDLFEEELSKDLRTKSHYHGDVIRNIFIVSGFVMLFTLPVFKDLVSVPFYVSSLIIIFLGLFAGLTNPFKKWVIGLNVLVSAVGVIVFEYYAVNQYFLINEDERVKWFFIVNMGLAIAFFIAFYYGTRTFKAMFLPKDKE